MSVLSKRPMGTVAYVGQGPFSEQFVRSWTQLIEFNARYVETPTHYVHYDFGSFSGQEETRNLLVERMQGDWILQLDGDHAFEPDVLQRMLRIFDGYDVDVLTALYQYRVPPYHYTIYKWYPDGGFKYVVPNDISWNSPPFQIDCAGAGTLLMRRRVFERISAELAEGGPGPFTRWYPWSEDFAFFQRLMKLTPPVKSWCAPAIRTFHLRSVETQPGEYDAAGLRIVKAESVLTIDANEVQPGASA